MPVKDPNAYFEKHLQWQSQLKKLHDLILETGLQPTIKWGAPVYTLEGKNVIGLGAFKNHYAIWFFNGVFLKHNTDLLVNAQENKTKALRQIRFEKNDEWKKEEILPYLKEAIENQKAGKEMKPVQKKKLIIPLELKKAFKDDEDLKASFDTLTPGKQREYADHVSSAKQEKTKYKRIEKITPMIKNGVGLYDRYKNC